MYQGPGIIVNVPRSRGGAGGGGTAMNSLEASCYVARARRRSSAARRSTVHLDALDAATGLDLERLAYINTALEAVPGMTLRQFFAPVARVRGRLMVRQRASRERFAALTNAATAAAAAAASKGRKKGTAAAAAAAAAPPSGPSKAVKDAVNQLAAALTSAAGEVAFGAPLAVDVALLTELLDGKLEPVSYRARDVLSLPCEPPEAAFVYILLAGSVRVTYFQPNLHHSAAPAAAAAEKSGSSNNNNNNSGGVPVSASRPERKQYFVTSDAIFPLCTESGLLSEADAGATEAALLNDAGTIVNDAASVSNLTSAIKRSLRKASRAVGQPTLQVTRTDVRRAPCVLGATEALGLSPASCVSVAAAATAPTGAAPSGGAAYEEYTDVIRVRALDVHAALVEMARREASRGGVAACIAAARTRALSDFYPQTELLLRQSWLLQDTPYATLRGLVSRLTPRTYMPGDVIACPHHNTSIARQLCFLRRGRLLVTEPPASARAKKKVGISSGGNSTSTNPRPTTGAAGCWRCAAAAAASPPPRVLEVVHAGASFGELSVLFGEARGYTLVADAVCDVWCLPHTDFASTMRRDDALRASLVEKAAALRLKWLGEQRFTAALAAHLRRYSELLRPFPDLVLRLIQERLEPVVYSPGELITSTSEKCGEVIFIMQGRVESICEGVASYGPGHVIGEGCLIAHRCPLGLAARTMVEGWRLPRAKLVEALERADILHAHSGEITNYAPVILKKIFSPPVPEAESDVVGRQRMPVVGPAPGGLSYPAYGRAVAEVLLKALCLTYRDYVKWEDISYATMETGGGGLRGGVASDVLARELVIAKMRSSRGGVASGVRDISNPSAGAGAPPVSVADAVGAHAAAKAAPQAAAKKKPRSRGSSAAAGSGRAAAQQRRAERGGGKKPRRRVNTGASAFLLDDAVEGGGAADSSAAAAAAAAGGGGEYVTPAVRHAQRVPPRLRQLGHTLAERDRALAEEQRRGEELERQLAAEQDANVKEHLLTTAAGGADGHGLDSHHRDGENRDPLTTTAAAAAAASASGALSPSSAAVVAGFAAPLSDPLPPVHLFLSGPHPRTHLSMAEAISIGYVMQLPDSDSVQACVSFVDPDVTIGPPQQRGRRHAMAITPNSRHRRHNFLFAAAVFENVSRLEAELKGLREEEQQRRDKATKLMTMLRASENRSRWQSYGNSRGQTTDPSQQQQQQPQDTILASGRDGFMESPSRDRSPMYPGSRARSPGGAPGVSTPSPFRGSPGKSAAKKEEGFERLLARDPDRAVEMLRVKYQLPATAPGEEGEGEGEGAAATRAPPVTLNATGSQESGASVQPPPESETTAVQRSSRSSSLLMRLRAAGNNTATTATAAAGGEGSAGDSRLPIAGARDRNVAQQTYLSTVDGQFPAGAGGEKDRSQRSLSTTALLLGAAQAATAESYITQRRDSVPYVDSYGALGVSGEARAGGSVVLTPAGSPAAAAAVAAAASPAGGGAAFHAVRRGSGSAGRPPQATGGARRSSTSYSFFNRDDDGAPLDGSMMAPLTPEDFVMPDVADATALIHRIQRDVEGLNAVAKAQAHERRLARRQEQQQQRGGGGRAAARRAQELALLSRPSDEERVVLEDWQRATHAMLREPFCPVVVPRALGSEAGPDHLRVGVVEVNREVAEQAAREAAIVDVAGWQQEQELQLQADATPPRGGESGGLRSAMAPGTSGTSAPGSDPASARRTIAPIGTSQLGYSARPLQSVAAAADVERRRQEREQFFEAFKRDPTAFLSGAAVAMDLDDDDDEVEREEDAAAAAKAAGRARGGLPPPAVHAPAPAPATDGAGGWCFPSEEAVQSSAAASTASSASVGEGEGAAAAKAESVDGETGDAAPPVSGGGADETAPVDVAAEEQEVEEVAEAKGGSIVGGGSSSRRSSGGSSNFLKTHTDNVEDADADADDGGDGSALNTQTEDIDQPAVAEAEEGGAVDEAGGSSSSSIHRHEGHAAGGSLTGAEVTEDIEEDIEESIAEEEDVQDGEEGGDESPEMPWL